MGHLETLEGSIYIFFVKDITYINEASDDELSLHHEYSINAATKTPDKCSSSQIISRQLVILICLVTR